MITGGSIDLVNYIQKSGDATYFLAISYMLTLIVSARKLYTLQKAVAGRWDPSSIFLASVVFASVIRFLSYATLCILSFESVRLRGGRAGDDDDDGHHRVVMTTHQDFYLRVLEVLFNVGDFVFLTAYMMLVVLWAECFQQAKRHVYSSSSLKRKWLMAYLITVTSLYTLLIVLYSLFLVSTTATRSILDAIYSILGFIDLAVPLGLIAAYCCLNFMYSGFPKRSDVLVKRWTNINRVVTYWSIGRIAYGVASILVAAMDWASYASTWQFAVALVSLELVAEILPFIFAPIVDTSESLAGRMKEDDEVDAEDRYEPPTAPQLEVKM